MRLFQNIGLTRGYYKYFRRHSKPRTFAEGRAQFLETRYGASHILAPVLCASLEAFHTNGDDRHLQLLWAREHGLRSDDLEQILLTQIEHHQTEVFYNLDPLRYGSSLVNKLPGCVKRSICWRAAPSGAADLSGYSLVICNFPSILDDWKQKGCKTAYFAPAHDPVMDAFVGSRRNAVDLIFAGGFSQEHTRRTEMLRVAAAVPNLRVRFHLEDSRFTRLATVLPFIPGLGKYRHPSQIRALSDGPLYGRDLYEAFAGTRIVLNGAIDMAGEDRGNMRCFEATGCGALLLTDSGRYPDGFVDGETMVTYSSSSQIPRLVEQIIEDTHWAESIAKAGRDMVRDRYSKARQWSRFLELI